MFVMYADKKVLEQSEDTELQKNHDNAPQLVKASGGNLLVIKRPTILSSMKDPLSKGEGLRVKTQTVKNVNIIKLSHPYHVCNNLGNPKTQYIKVNILGSL